MKTILVLFVAGLAQLHCARAQISYLIPPSPIEYGPTPNATPFSVSSSASMLVVLMRTRNQGNSTNPGNPTNVKWNGNVLKLPGSTNTSPPTVPL